MRRAAHAEKFFDGALELFERARVIFFGCVYARGCEREIFEREALAARFAVELGQRSRQPAATDAERQPRDLDVAVADELGKNFFDDQLQHHRRAMFVEQQKLRIDARFDRKLAQHARAKAVNRGDHCAVERAFVVEPAAALFFVGDAQHLVELAAQAFAHFVGGAIGESDRDDLIDGETVFAEDVDVALDEDGRLARPRPCRHRDVFVDLVCGGGLFW